MGIPDTTAGKPARGTDDQSKAWGLWTGRLRAAAEIIVATILLLIGIGKLQVSTDASPWMPVGLIALAFVIYSLRGRGLSELAIGKDGISLKLQELEKKTEIIGQTAVDAGQKADAAEQQAIAAEQKASLAKGIITQVARPMPAAPQPEEVQTLAANNGWKHPKLKPRKQDPDDPQRGQWGGSPRRNDRELTAKVDPTDDPEWFEVTVEVRSTSPQQKPLENRVRFHLHDSYRQQVVTEKPKDGVARIERYAYGGFTVGAEVENEPDTFLELNLYEVDAPSGFLEN